MKNVIARSKTTKRSTISHLVLALVLTILFSACGDESTSSSVIPEPADDSSSSVAPASSSSKKDETSSSSVEKAKESSSSVKPSSSSEAKSSSSEEVKQSSSSVVASSSSVAEQSSSSSYDRTDAFKGTLWRAGAYKTFVDPRDNREYYYIEIAGEDTAGKAATIKVMAENLNVGELVRGRKNQEDDTKIERYCYENDTTNCNKYGGLYQWAEMMQLPSRCNTTMISISSSTPVTINMAWRESVLVALAEAMIVAIALLGLGIAGITPLEM